MESQVIVSLEIPTCMCHRLLMGGQTNLQWPGLQRHGGQGNRSMGVEGVKGLRQHRKEREGQG